MRFSLHNNKVFSIAFLFVLFSITSCVKKDFDKVKEDELVEIPSGTATMTIKELKNLRAGEDDNTITEIPKGTVIVGQVISSDEGGNIYKELYIQDATSGITIRIDGSVLYTSFQLGQQIAINCDDLVLGSYGQRIQLGIESVYNGSPSAGQIPLPIMKNHVTLGTISEIVPKVITIAEANSKLNEYAGMYIRIEQIQVARSSKGKSYAIENKTTNRYFSTCKNGTDIILRTSGYADFQTKILPNGLGNIEATLTRFRDTPQLVINSPKDMKDFTGNTVDLPNCDGPSQGGNTPPLVDAVNETFDGTKYAPVLIDGWNVIIETGTKGWMYNEYTTNTYANISVYKAGEARKSWLITPLLNVDKASNKVISFDSRSEFLETATLKVYVSSNYDGSKAPSEFTWTEIHPTIGTGSSSSYGDWTPSGNQDISSYGNVVVAFVYEGEEGSANGGFSIDNFKFNDGDTGGGGVDPPYTGNYYDQVAGKTGYELKTALFNIIKNADVLKYTPGLWDAYYTTDDKYGQEKVIWDIYSDVPDKVHPEIPDGDEQGKNSKEYEYRIGTDQAGNFSAEGQKYNREHTMPQSWFKKAKPMVTDLMHILPTDGKVNGMRSNHPYGVVANVQWTSNNYSKLGTDSSGRTVFEPIDEYKGDVARIYFYMATRYQDKIGSWESNSSNADLVLDGSSDKVFEDWELNILKQWAKNDPVSQKEIDRNEAVFKIQKNRNPFVDHPEYIKSIWGN